MVGMAVVGQWTLCVASPSPRVKSATCNSNSCPTTVNLRSELSAFRPQFRLFSRVSPTRRRRLCASSSADSGIFLPHLVASMVSVSPPVICLVTFFCSLLRLLFYIIRSKLRRLTLWSNQTASNEAL